MKEPQRLTSGEHPDMLLYFTANSILEDDRRFVFFREEEGCQNLFIRDPQAGTEKQLTYYHDRYTVALPIHNFRFNDGNAVSVASAVLHAKTGMIYFIKGRQLHRCDLKGNDRILTTLPSGTCTSCAHVNEDGTKYLISTVDDRAFDDYDGSDSAAIDKRVQQLGLCSQLRVYDTMDGKELLCENIPNAWVTHVQFCPLDDRIILYNHEWPADCGIRRLWLFDGVRHQRVRTEGEGRSRRDWTCHEMWERGTGNLIYHGQYEDGRSYIGRVKFLNFPDITQYTLTEIPLPEGYVKYGHFTVSNTNLLVTDGYYQEPGDVDEPGEWAGRYITILKPDWEKGTIEWIPLCRHGSRWDCQESHPHPVFNHRADAVYFTSNCSGKRAVYCVKL